MAIADLSPDALLDAARTGDRGALARLLTVVEAGGTGAQEVARLAHPLGGAAHTVGITGAPGAGKSTLTGALVACWRESFERVAVLAIDPSSPFTGGAILGDRVRMGAHALDDGVFIRSMATRGHLGGLALAAPEAVRLLDAVGYPWVVIETVGVGQVEVEVVGTADTVVVVVNPGWGDSVQANKAGLTEIADIFVVNKADRPAAAEAVHDLESMLDLSVSASGAGDWRPPVLTTVGTTGEGVPALADAIAAHRQHLVESGGLEVRRRSRLDDELRRILAERLRQRADELGSGGRFEAARTAVLDRALDPWTAVDELLGGAD